MERLAQYWDDLDDLIGAIRLYGENIRRMVLFAFAAFGFLGGVTGAAILAFYVPQIGMAFVTLLLVTLMYTSVTSPRGLQDPVA